MLSTEPCRPLSCDALYRIASTAITATADVSTEWHLRLMEQVSDRLSSTYDYFCSDPLLFHTSALSAVLTALRLRMMGQLQTALDTLLTQYVAFVAEASVAETLALCVGLVLVCEGEMGGKENGREEDLGTGREDL